MRKIFLLLIALVLYSCNSDEGDGQKVHYELTPITDCEMPYRFTSGQTYEFEMFYHQPSSCHFYKGIYFEKQGNTRIVAIQSGVVESNSCVTYEEGSSIGPELSSAKCNFTATGHEPYTFRFWTGKNAQGEDTYYDVVVPVDN